MRKFDSRKTKKAEPSWLILRKLTAKQEVLIASYMCQ